MEVYRYERTEQEIRELIEYHLREPLRMEGGRVLSGQVNDNRIVLQASEPKARGGANTFTRSFSGKLVETEQGCQIEGRFWIHWSIAGILLIIAAGLIQVLYAGIVSGSLMEQKDTMMVAAGIAAVLMGLESLMFSSDQKALVRYLERLGSSEQMLEPEGMEKRF